MGKNKQVIVNFTISSVSYQTWLLLHISENGAITMSTACQKSLLGLISSNAY